MTGVTKDHKDIDLLKYVLFFWPLEETRVYLLLKRLDHRLRSIAVSKRFTDAEVLSPDFLQTVYEAMEVLCPLVQCINEVRLGLSEFANPFANGGLITHHCPDDNAHPSRNR